MFRRWCARESTVATTRTRRSLFRCTEGIFSSGTDSAVSIAARGTISPLITSCRRRKAGLGAGKISPPRARDATTRRETSRSLKVGCAFAPSPRRRQWPTCVSSRATAGLSILRRSGYRSSQFIRSSKRMNSEISLPGWIRASRDAAKRNAKFKRAREIQTERARRTELCTEVSLPLCCHQIHAQM